MPNIQKITLETLYTPWTLDTYGTFTLENEDEYILENFNEDKPKDAPEITYDDLEWTYDMDGYLKALAENLLEKLQENIRDEIILDVSSDLKVSRPREYNFTTDCAWLDFTVDMDKLAAFIDAHKADYEENCIRSRDGFMWLGDEEHTMINYYLETVSEKLYPEDEYINDQFENVYAGEFVSAEPVKK